MNSNFFKKNRDNLAERFDKNSLFVIFAGFAPFRRGDELYEFTPQRNFYYLTGLDNPNIIFSLYKDSNGEITEKLFLERFDEVEAKWVGEVIQKEEAKEKSGIGEFGFIDEFESYASKILFDKMPTVCFDLENRTFYAPLTPDVAFANKLKERFPALTIKDVRSDFAWLRAVKSPEEIEEIKSAISITNEGISSMMKNAFNEMYEYEAEAYFDFELKRRGAEYAFKSIVASGKNATILHYVNNNTKSSNGDLLLCDVGAAHGFYSSDITRTFPISGKFSERQKQIYNIVLAGQQVVINAAKPEISFKQLNEKLKNFYFEELKKIGLVKEKSDVEKYYYHGVSHPLGLETHDIGRDNDEKLRVGMIITVEPGLYIEEEGIGIRIEDDILITETGADVLSKEIIKDPDEIELFISKNRNIKV